MNRRDLFKSMAGAALLPLAPILPAMTRSAVVVPAVATAAPDVTTIIHLYGQVFSRVQVRALLDQLNAEYGNVGRTIIT